MREEWADFIKGCAIYIVILGHSIQYIYCHGENMEANMMFSIIYSFHMALFAMVSGYLHFYFSKKYGIIQGIKRKLQSILIPCLIWGTLQYLYTVLRGWNAIEFQKWAEYIMYHNWFLWAVLYCSIVALVCKKTNIYLVGCLIMLTAWLWPDFYNLIDFKMMYPAYLFGYAANEYNIVVALNKYGLRVKCAIVVLLAFLYIVAMRNVVSFEDIMWWQYYYNGINGNNIHLSKRLLINFLGMTLFVCIGLIIESVCAESKIVRGIKELGKNSLGIYMVQTLVFGFGLGILYRFSVEDGLVRWIFTILWSCVITVFSNVMVIIINKNGLAKRLLLGKIGK